MKEIIIINLTRIGDLLQTTPLMAGLKEGIPDLRLTLVANSSYVEICKGISFIDELIVFNIKGFKKDVLQGQKSLVENFRFLEELVSEINKKEYDMAINLTHSTASAVLISLVRARELRGFTIDSEGNRAIKHPWMRYFFNVVPNRDYNPFHLVDMYLKAGDMMPERKGLFFEVSKEDEEKAEALLTEEGIVQDDILIGLQLGASKSDRRWPISYFATLAALMTAAFGAKILLFGSSAEAGLAEEFKMSSEVKPLNLMGKTSLGELSALLKRCTLLISNDSGPLHLATAVGTKVIGIFSVNAHFKETGPYSEGCYVVEADLPCVPCGFDVECKEKVCKHIIKPDAVFEPVKEVIEGKPAIYSPDSPLWDSVQVYKSHFRENGLLGFYPLIKRPLSKKTFYSLLYREVWGSTPDRTDGKVTMPFENLCTEISSFYSLDNIQEIITLLRKDIETIQHLVNLAYKGLNLINLIAKESKRQHMNVRKIRKSGQQIDSLDNEIDLLGHANPFLRPLVLIFTYSKEALEGNDLLILARASRRIYKDLLTHSSDMLQLLKGLMPFFESASEKKTCELVSGK